MILDIGCGDNPKGDVNVDLYRYTNQTGDQKWTKYVKTKCDIIASGEYLPIRDNVFENVVSHHVIEHTFNPKRFLLEAIRVSKSRILIACPHRKSPGARMPFHRQYLDENWFAEAVMNLGVGMTFEITTEGYFPPFIMSRNRYVRYIMRHYWPIRRLDGLKIEILK